VLELQALGQVDFGENYVQEAKTKVPLVQGARWHLIGPLQKNKINQALELFSVFHTLDSLELIRALDSRAARAGRQVQGMLQIHQGEETSKHGLQPEQLPRLLADLAAEPLTHLKLIGLMSIPPPPQPPASNAVHFAALRKLLEEHASGFAGHELSMGMSDDFPVAVAEGATWIRVGRALFGAR
jgi:pyridoxal phosphate enzyme (YggS family)